MQKVQTNIVNTRKDTVSWLANSGKFLIIKLLLKATNYSACGKWKKQGCIVYQITYPPKCRYFISMILFIFIFFLFHKHVSGQRFSRQFKNSGSFFLFGLNSKVFSYSHIFMIFEKLSSDKESQALANKIFLKSILEPKILSDSKKWR